MYFPSQNLLITIHPHLCFNLPAPHLIIVFTRDTGGEKRVKRKTKLLAFGFSEHGIPLISSRMRRWCCESAHCHLFASFINKPLTLLID